MAKAKPSKADKASLRRAQLSRKKHLQKYSYTTYKIGPQKKTCIVKLPKPSYRQKVSMARKFLRLNYICSRKNPNQTKNKYPAYEPKQFRAEVVKIKAMPFKRRFYHRTVHRSTKKGRFRDPEELKECKKAYGLPLDDSSPAEPITDENTSEPANVQQADEWKIANWPKQMWKDSLTVEFNEPLSNLPIYTGPKFFPSLFVMFMESLRAGLYNQDWNVVAKSMEGIFEEGRIPIRNQHPLIWNAGILSILRFAKGDREKVKQFTRIFRESFKPKAYGRRLGNDVGLWLTQEGYFNEAMLFLDEMETLSKQKGSRFITENFRLSFNPKRDLIDLMANLIRAVFLYAIWKRDSHSASEGEYEGTEVDLRRSGENALSSFESLLEIADDCGADPSTFLEPLIELTLEYRSKDRAKDLVKDLMQKHYGNAFVEGAYLQFLKQNFPDLTDEIKAAKELQRKFSFKPESAWSHQSRELSLYKSRKMEKVPQTAHFKKLPNPGFSW